MRTPAEWHSLTRRPLTVRQRVRRRSRIDWGLLVGWGWALALGWGVVYLGFRMGWELALLVVELATH